MAQCPNGSQVRSGAPTTFWVFDWQVMNWIATAIPKLAGVLSLVFPNELVLTSDFCSTEPVVPPDPSLTDFVGAFTPWGNMATITAWVRAKYKESVWPTYCQCQPGGAPAGSLESYILSLGPTYWWKFADAAGASSAADSSGNTNTMTFGTPPTFNTPKICPNAAGTCATWSASSGLTASGGSIAINNQSGKLGIGGFLKAAAPAANRGMYSTYNANNDYQFASWLTTGKLQVGCRNASGTQYTYVTTRSVADGVAHFWYMEIDYSAHTITAYVDGNLDGSVTFTGNIWNDTASMVWGDTTASFISQDWFMIKGGLTPAQIGNIYWYSGLGGGPSFTPTPVVVPTGVATPATNTCTTTADLCAAVAQLRAEVAQIGSMVLSNSPAQGTRSLAASTVHSGLTGSGTLTVAGLRGVKVEITAHPAGTGSHPASPTLYYKIGIVQVGNPEGYRERVDLNRITTFVELTPTDTLVGYFFPAGVTATITEVVSGPI